MLKNQDISSRRVVLVLGAFLALGACTTNLGGGSLAEGIGFREARHAEVTSVNSYRICTAEALEMADQARTFGSPARHLTAARMFEQCESDLGPEAAQIAQEERMRAYSNSILGYLRGGDVASARANLDHFQDAFPGYDLYLADGSSFIDSMELLLGSTDRTDIAELAVSNISEELRADMRRVRYWERN
jgi:hypothetical protein